MQCNYVENIIFWLNFTSSSSSIVKMDHVHRTHSLTLLFNPWFSGTGFGLFFDVLNHFSKACWLVSSLFCFSSRIWSSASFSPIFLSGITKYNYYLFKWWYLNWGGLLILLCCWKYEIALKCALKITDSLVFPWQELFPVVQISDGQKRYRCRWNNINLFTI